MSATRETEQLPAGAHAAPGIPRTPAPSIAVVIPFYNQERLLARAVASVIWQLEACDELIVVDDGSIDLQGSDGLGFFRREILWLKNPARCGFSQARNMAITRSHADWVKFLEAGDVLAPFALHFLREAGPSLPEFIQVLAGGVHRMHYSQYRDFVSIGVERFQNILEENPIPASAAFVRRRALLAVGMFDERIDFEEDWDLWLKLNERFGQNAFGVSERTVCYFQETGFLRHQPARRYTVDGTPVREYFQQRYGVRLKG